MITDFKIRKQSTWTASKTLVRKLNIDIENRYTDRRH